MTTGPTPSARPSLNALVAAEIRAEMGRQGITPRRLAELLGVSEAWTTRHISVGSATQMLTFDKLERIADALGVPPLKLIPEDFPPEAGIGRRGPTPESHRPNPTRPRPKPRPKRNRATSTAVVAA